MKVLITGAGGFIGSHLVNSQLNRGNFVRAVDLDLRRLNRAEQDPRLEKIQGDVTDPGLVRNLVDEVDIVYHLASAHLDTRIPEADYRRVNVAGTQILLQAAMQAGVRRFVHCSSVGVIGDVKNPPADETTDCRPTNIYEQTKLEGEEAAVGFARQNGFPVVIARPAWVYGPHCPRTEKLLRAISKGRFLFFGSGENLRHPIYVNDAVRGLELCAEPGSRTGEVYIIAGEIPVQVVDLVALISQELGVRPPRFRLPVAVGRGGAAVLELVYQLTGGQPPFTRRSLDFFVKNNAYDTGKAQRELGFRPRADLRAGIRETIEWWKSNGEKT